MTQNRDFVDDLLVRARRGELSEPEQSELEHALESSIENRLLFEAGSGFDAEASVEPGDELLIARMAREVPKRARPRRPSALRHFVQGVLVGALLTGLAVASVQSLSEHWGSREALESAPKPKRGSETPPRRESQPSTETTPGEPVAVAPPSEPAHEAAPAASAPVAGPALGSNERAPAATRPHELSPLANENAAAAVTPAAPAEQAFPDAPSAATPLTAAGLYAAGNRARVAGDWSRAVSLYRQLAQTFPQSAEANAAHLALGVLYLEQGQASAALSELHQRRGSGASEAEALWTEAQADQKLGRSADERAALEQLLRAFPSSAYVTAARKRLAEQP
jgi:tetratricopeptide (TPR) repeat protein